MSDTSVMLRAAVTMAKLIAEVERLRVINIALAARVHDLEEEVDNLRCELAEANERGSYDD